MGKKKRKKMEAAKQQQKDKREARGASRVRRAPACRRILWSGWGSEGIAGVTRMGEGVTNTVDTRGERVTASVLGTSTAASRRNLARQDMACKLSDPKQPSALSSLRSGEGGNQTRRRCTWMDTLTARCRLSSYSSASSHRKLQDDGSKMDDWERQRRQAEQSVHPDGRLGLRGGLRGRLSRGCSAVMQMETRAAGVRYWLLELLDLSPMQEVRYQERDKARRQQTETEIARCRYPYRHLERHRARLLPVEQRRAGRGLGRCPCLEGAKQRQT
ncbi:hypothetical protein V8C44DRAFT_188713 [Trichoderma aethiopicum]